MCSSLQRDHHRLKENNLTTLHEQKHAFVSSLFSFFYSSELLIRLTQKLFLAQIRDVFSVSISTLDIRVHISMERKERRRNLVDFYDNLIFPFMRSCLISWLPTMIFPRAHVISRKLFSLNGGKLFFKFYKLQSHSFLPAEMFCENFFRLRCYSEVFKLNLRNVRLCFEACWTQCHITGIPFFKRPKINMRKNFYLPNQTRPNGKFRSFSMRITIPKSWFS